MEKTCKLANLWFQWSYKFGYLHAQFGNLQTWQSHCNRRLCVKLALHSVGWHTLSDLQYMLTTCTSIVVKVWMNESVYWTRWDISKLEHNVMQVVSGPYKHIGKQYDSCTCRHIKAYPVGYPGPGHLKLHNTMAVQNMLPAGWCDWYEI